MRTHTLSPLAWESKSRRMVPVDITMDFFVPQQRRSEKGFNRDGMTGLKRPHPRLVFPALDKGYLT